MEEKVPVRRKSLGVKRVVGREMPRGTGSSKMERLQKALASAGAGSRRSCEELISAGRVTVNGVPVTLGTKVDPLLDRVTVDGRPVDLRPRRPVCIIMYKPRGYVTTRRDPHGRRTVMDLVREDIPGLHPVGRLDYDSEGLLLLTNDGGITYRLTHPKHEVDKTYEVSVEGVPGGSVLDRLRTGVRLQEGTTAPARAGILRTSENRAVVKISIHQGWNRQVRRMFEAVGHPVVRLKRTAYGPLRLGRLKPGQYRFLSDEEMDSLRAPGQGPGRALPGGRGRERNWSRST